MVTRGSVRLAPATAALPSDDPAPAILAFLPDDLGSTGKLRARFVGRRLAEPHLRASGFRCLVGTGRDWALWRRTLVPGQRQVVLNCAPGGLLCRVDSLCFVDLEEHEGVGAPCGWYLDGELCASSHRALATCLEAATEPAYFATPALEWAHWLHLLGRRTTAAADPAAELAAMASSCRERPRDGDARIAALLTTALVRHLAAIEHPGVLRGLFLLAARLCLPGECQLAMRHLLQREPCPPASVWSDLGAALTDTLRQPGLGLRCFAQSIALDPRLASPREGVWAAGKRLLGQLIADRNLAATPAVIEHVAALGGAATADHGFWAYAGLCQEALGDLAAAARSYAHGLRLQPACDLSRTGRTRLIGRREPADTVTQALAWVAERHPWNAYRREPLDYRTLGMAM